MFGNPVSPQDHLNIFTIFAGLAAKVRMGSGQEGMEDTLKDSPLNKRTRGKVSEDLSDHNFCIH